MRKHTFSSPYLLSFILNLYFESNKEIRPNATMQQSIIATLEGANPVLAPGILTLGAVIGLAATYQHEILDAN